MNESLYNRELKLFAQVGGFFSDVWEKLNDFLGSPQWENALFNIKIGFLILSILLVVLIILLILKISIITPLHRSFKRPSAKSDTPVFSKKKIAKRWTKIENKLNSGIEANYKLAVIEADKLFDMILKNFGYERGKKLTSIDEIKAAGKIKDKIFEDKKIKISKEEAEKLIEAYKKGLEELEVL